MRSILALIFLRMAFAFVFFSAAVSSIVTPKAWVQYIPDFVTQFFPAYAVLTVFVIYEVLLAVLLVFRRSVRGPALLAAITFVAIAFTHISEFETAFRDLGLALAAMALLFLDKVRS